MRQAPVAILPALLASDLAHAVATNPFSGSDLAVAALAMWLAPLAGWVWAGWAARKNKRGHAFAGATLITLLLLAFAGLGAGVWLVLIAGPWIVCIAAVLAAITRRHDDGPGARLEVPPDRSYRDGREVLVGDRVAMQGHARPSATVRAVVATGQWARPFSAGDLSALSSGILVLTDRGEKLYFERTPDDMVLVARGDKTGIDGIPGLRPE